MANNDSSYLETIAAMRRERHQRAAQSRIVDVVREHDEAAEARDQAIRSGDQDTADYCDAEAERLEAEYARLCPPSNELSERKQRWLSERWDLPRGPQTEQLALGAHTYVTKYCGIAEDTPAYFDAMAVYLEPPGYQTPITPDEVCKNLGIDAKTYNRNVRRLEQMKASGALRDR